MAQRLCLQIDRVRSACYLEHDENFLFRSRNDDAWRIFYLESGAMTADIGDGPQVVRDGYAVLCAPGELYAIGAYNQPSNLLILSYEHLNAKGSAPQSWIVPVSNAMCIFLQNIRRQVKENHHNYPIFRQNNWRANA